MKTLMCVIDFEATCWPDHKAPAPDGQGTFEPPTEIIEIGAMMVAIPGVDSKGEFDLFVRPKIHPKLTAFCTKLTSIRQQDVDAAPPFPEALERFETWLKTYGPREQILFASWGRFDKTQLLKDCHLHGTAFPFDGEHFDIKLYAASQIGGYTKGVEGTLGRLAMTFEGTPHRGIDDVRNIVRILRSVGIETSSQQFARAHWRA